MIPRLSSKVLTLTDMSFINDNFMLQTETARELYHGHAEKMPIIDYHCHLVPQQIAENIRFRDITQLWLVDGLRRSL